jgi:hypothetical protein
MLQAVIMRGGRRDARRPSGALRTHGPVRNIRAVNVLCTSFPRRLRRIARSRVARIIVCVLALALTAANIASAAMPPMSMAAAAPAAAMATSHHTPAKHCADDGASVARTTHPGHGADCACCIGKSCACAHACDLPDLAAAPSPAKPSTRIFAVSPARVYSAIEARPLRPPIS